MNNNQETKLNTRVSGEGYPVVFLHGFLETSSMWKNLLPGFTKNILIDLPGHGKSDVIAESIDEMADMVIATIRELVDGEYMMVGHSMGGYVGLEIVRKDHNCQKLILLNSNYWADSAEKKKDRDRVAHIVHSRKDIFIYESIPNLFHDPTIHDEEVRALVHEAVLMSPEAIAASSLAMKNRKDSSRLLMQSPVNFTVIQGNNDPVVDRDRVSSFCRASDVNYYELESGHMAHIEATKEVMKILEKEIKKTETD